MWSRNYYPSGAPEFTPVISGYRVARSSDFCVMFCRSLFVLLFLSFWSLCCLFYFRFTASDYPFGIYKLFLVFIEDIEFRSKLQYYMAMTYDHCSTLLNYLNISDFILQFYVFAHFYWSYFPLRREKVAKFKYVKFMHTLFVLWVELATTGTILSVVKEVTRI
jgi:hypothetical protein